MALICQQRRLSLNDLSRALQDGCAVRVDRGARRALVESMTKISEQQIQCATPEGEEFCLCERSVSSGSVGIDISDPFEGLKEGLRLGDLLRITTKNISYSGILIKCIPKLTIRSEFEQEVSVRKKEYNYGKVVVEKLPRRWESRSDWCAACLISNRILFTKKHGCLIPESDLGSSIMFQQLNGVYVAISKETLQSKQFAACLLSREACKGMDWPGLKIQRNHSSR
ncbi:MAG: hypothetical protein H7A39_03125 [Chlamydiales bacterium]|nr:hypothetical protein [Chlamydiales bacterium]